MMLYSCNDGSQRASNLSNILVPFSVFKRPLHNFSSLLTEEQTRIIITSLLFPESAILFSIEYALSQTPHLSYPIAPRLS